MIVSPDAGVSLKEMPRVSPDETLSSKETLADTRGASRPGVTVEDQNIEQRLPRSVAMLPLLHNGVAAAPMLSSLDDVLTHPS